MKYIVLISLLSLAGCTADKLFNDPVPDGVLPEIHFRTVAGTRAEAATENLVADAKVCIYPYWQKTGVDAPAVDPKGYTVSNSDLIPAGTDGKAMILPSGTFKFYAVSTNSAETEVPAFDATASDGLPILGNGAGQSGTSSAALTNGVDYLHVMAEKTIQFGTETTVVPLVFEHKANQLQLTIKFGEKACAPSAYEDANFALAEVWVQQTNPANSYMRLNSGEIRFGNTTAAPPMDCSLGADGKPQDNTGMAQMTVVKLQDYSPGTLIPATQVATYTMLPLAAASGGTLKLWVKVLVKNIKVGTAPSADASRTYIGKLDASAGWKPGESNRYTLTLSGSKINFSGVTVRPWVSGGSGGEVGDVTDN